MSNKDIKSQTTLSYPRETRRKSQIFACVKLNKSMRRIKKMENLVGAPFVERQLISIAELKEFLYVVTNANKLTYSNHVKTI